MGKTIFYGLILFILLVISSCTHDVDVTRSIAVNPPPVQKDEPTVILTDDDGYYSAYGLLPLLQSHGFHMDFFIVGSIVGYTEGGTNNKLASDNDRMGWNEIYVLDSLGNGIYNHTSNHHSPADSVNIACGYNILVEHGYTPDILAYPFGVWNDTTEVWAAEYSRAARTVDWGLNDHFFAYQQYHLKAVQVTSLISVARVESMVDSCQNLNKVLIIVWHDVCETPGCSISHKTYLGDIHAVLDYLVEKGIRVMTFREYLNR